MRGPSIPDSPLWERYTRPHGRVHLTGLQALVRLVLDQLRRDSRAGSRTAAFVSGYPGSPLAGFEGLLRGLAPLLAREHVRFEPGLNEELAAAAVSGTQLLELFPHARFDGVLGLWYGKAPGLDRSIDALRHANFAGASRTGGALVAVGDDPFCKSSSLPSHSEHAFAHAFVPLFAPADPADVLRLGHAAIALSRHAGLYCGLRLVADVADAGAIVELPRTDPVYVAPARALFGRPFAPRVDPALLPPGVMRLEEELVFGKLEAARAFLAANALDPIVSEHPRDKLGFVAAGPLFRELERALERLGLDEPERARLGVRLLKIDVVWPLSGARVREFAKGLATVVVVDGRRGFLEEQVRAALFELAKRPKLFGGRDPHDAPWLARRSELTSASLIADLAAPLAEWLGAPELLERAALLAHPDARAESASGAARTPHFCSGCPHSTSTRLPEGSASGGGIGCHTMTLLMDRDVRFVGAMGSEGTQWIGLAPYTEMGHIFQNLGDGTYFHSGRLAVRAAVEAGVTMTFKLLWNGVVAMTGGQTPVGAKPLAALVRDLLADGVTKIVAMSDDLELVRLAEGDTRVTRVERAAWDDAQRAIRTEPGVTALIYDSLCANEKQRLERRGLRPKPSERLFINEDVCEGCGDCGVKSSCVSLRPVATALGRKTRIHAGSCSDDRTCLDGDCPAFQSLDAAPLPPPPFESLVPDPLPEPPPFPWERPRAELLLVGIGSTGVVTIDALLVRAAEHDGLHAIHLDQTGLAQRGGKVVSHCLISREPIVGSPRICAGGADVLLAFDALGASDRETLRALDPARTRAVVHDLDVPTGADVESPSFTPRELETTIAPLRAATRSLELVAAEALADAALQQHLAANLVLLGFAWQRGLLPVSRAGLERAIRENGVAVAANQRAFALGRAAAADPELASRVLADSTPPALGDDPEAAERAPARLGATWSRLADALGRLGHGKDSDALVRRVAAFALDLADYQSTRLAARYCERLAHVALAEANAEPESLALTETAARELYRALAYKDEYEVARLALRGPFRRWLERRYGDVPTRVWLHPPLLRAFGLREKLAFGAAARGLFRALVALRRVRGTWLDPFARLPARVLDRELARWYEGVLERLCSELDAARLPDAVQIAGLFGDVRGYESVKAERAARVREVVERRLAR